ncbi:MAG: hypothetical protein AAGG80_03250, partial [Pseudomonadota bacterium]
QLKGIPTLKWYSVKLAYAATLGQYPRLTFAAAFFTLLIMEFFIYFMVFTFNREPLNFFSSRNIIDNPNDTFFDFPRLNISKIFQETSFILGPVIANNTQETLYDIIANQNNTQALIETLFVLQNQNQELQDTVTSMQNNLSLIFVSLLLLFISSVLNRVLLMAINHYFKLPNIFQIEQEPIFDKNSTDEFLMIGGKKLLIIDGIIPGSNVMSTMHQNKPEDLDSTTMKSILVGNSDHHSREAPQNSSAFFPEASSEENKQVKLGTTRGEHGLFQNRTFFIEGPQPDQKQIDSDKVVIDINEDTFTYS